MSDRSMGWDYETTTPGVVVHCSVYHHKEMKRFTLSVCKQTITIIPQSDGGVLVSRSFVLTDMLQRKLQDCDRYNRGRLEELRYAAPHLPITNQMIREVCEKHNLELKKPEGSSIAPEMQAH